MTDSNDTQNRADPIAEVLRDAGPRQALPAYDLESLGAPALAAWEKKLARKATRRRRFAVAALLTLVIGAGAFWRLSRSADPVAVVLAYSGEQSNDFPVGLEFSEGQTLTTGMDEWLTVELRDGHRVRLDAGSILGLSSRQRIDLQLGAVYVEAAPGPLQVLALGTVTEHVGTRYEVRIDGSSAVVRVREGEVQVQSEGRVVEIGRGRRVRVSDSKDPIVEESPPFGESWAWTRRSAPEFEGNSLPSFLDWIEAETGREVEVAPELIYKPSGEPISIIGGTGGMSLEEALASVLQTAGLAHTAEGDRIIVTALNL